METYGFIKALDEGTYGSVFQARKKQTGEIVAIKRIKNTLYSSWDQCLQLNEVRSLAAMNHPNIIKLKELIHQNDVLFFVFECMDCNLFNLMKARGTKLPFSESEIKKWCIQVFSGLAHMHRRGYLHRDLKPENLLVKQDIINIADLGTAREINLQEPYTRPIGTLWYRAPELLRQPQIYDSKVDMWAMGAIMAEMFMGFVLFQGDNEADQLSRIWSFSANDNRMSKLVPNASPEAIDLMNSLCSWEPRDRPTAAEALQHPFFRRGCCLPLGTRVSLMGPPPGFESLSRGSRPMMIAADVSRVRAPPPPRPPPPPPGFESSSKVKTK